jgi:hypothetical protein
VVVVWAVSISPNDEREDSCEPLGPRLLSLFVGDEVLPTASGWLEVTGDGLSR